MRLVVLLAAAALMGACAPGPGGPVARIEDEVRAAPTPAPEDTCGLEANKHLIGVHQDEIDRASLPAGARIVCPTCMVTQDYAPSRLNLHTDTAGRVASMRCG